MPDLSDLLEFAEQGDIEASKKLLQWSSNTQEARGATLARVDPVVGRTALHKAAEAGHAEYVKWMLELEVDHLQPDGTGVTALHVAAVNGFPDVCKVLLDFDGPEKNLLKKQNAAGEAPMHWASIRGNISVMKLFIDKAGSIAKEMQDNRGNRPLHYAALNNREEATLFLMNHNAERCPANADGDTPLHCAARKGALASLQPLLSIIRGEDRLKKNKNGQTPADVACTETVKELLLAATPDAISSKMRFANDNGKAVNRSHLLADEKLGIKPRSFASGGRNLIDDDH